MTNQRLLEQFRSFYFKNYPDDMEQQISYFAVFGGLNWEIDTSRNIQELIYEKILKNFHTLHRQIEELTCKDPNYTRLLRSLATGDRRIFSAFNKAGLNNGNGGAALNFLNSSGLIEMEYSREKHPRERYPYKKLKREDARHRISHKVLFTHPFLRFWFYFIVPNIKAIEAQEYTKMLDIFTQKQGTYTSLVYEELSEILLNYHLRDVSIASSGSYWDAKIEIDILTVTDKGTFYVGECKWSNHKVNKNELHKLSDKCQKLHIHPEQIILFSKRGFSKELQKMQGKKLALYSSEDFSALLKNRENEPSSCQELFS